MTIAGFGAAGAAPAAAATADPADVSFDCVTNVDGALDETFTGEVGDTFTVSSTGGNCWLAQTTGVHSPVSVSFEGYAGVVTVTGTISDSGAEYFGATASFTIVGEGAFTIRHGNGIAYSSTFTISSPGSGSGEESSPIPAWVQAYGRFGEDAGCLAGWDPSWQSWATPVTGGWVCTRSIPSLG